MVALLLLAAAAGGLSTLPGKGQRLALAQPHPTPQPTVVAGTLDDTFLAERRCRAEARKYVGPPGESAPLAVREAALTVYGLPFRGCPTCPLLPEFRAQLETACRALGHPLVFLVASAPRPVPTPAPVKVKP